MNPRTEALAFRIWQFCNPREWDCDINEIAEHTRVSPQAVIQVLSFKKWVSRVRVLRKSTVGITFNYLPQDKLSPEELRNVREVRNEG